MLTTSSPYGVGSPILSDHSENEILRGETFDDDHLIEHARHIATSHLVVSLCKDADRLIDRSKYNCQVLATAIRTVRAAAQTDSPLSSTAEFLLEKSSALEQQLRQVREGIPKHMSEYLAKLETGEPRVFALCMEYLYHSDCHVDLPTLLRFIREYQTVVPLTIAEVWSLPTMILIGLVENLRRVTMQLIGPARAQQVMRLTERFRSTSNNPSKTRHDEETQPQSVNIETFKNISASLRTMSEVDLLVFFESACQVDVVLGQDPAHVYSLMDFQSRNRCRQVVEELARRTGTPEVEVARRAKEFAEAGLIPGDIRQRHVGYYLIDQGRDKLEAALGYRPPRKEALSRLVLRNATLVYLAGIGMLTVIGAGLAVLLAAMAGGSVVACLFAAALSIIPASELAISIVHYWVTRWFPPRILPKLEFKQGVPASCQSIVVIPALLSDEQSADQLVERLERHFLANPGPHLSFGLLTDFRDAPSETMPVDQDLRTRLVEGIRKLNHRYRSLNGGHSPGKTRDRFFLFHRERRWNPAEGVWMGWERKRGKLIEFNRLLLGATDTSFTILEGDFNRLPKVRYVVTLDADTKLPHGTVNGLVGTLVHPLNRAQIVESPEGKKVTSGYTLLQPRVGTTLTSCNRSWFAWMFANGAGLSPYATANSDVYQDLFGEGNFCGKGIYDVEAFEAVLDQAFPENQILSHDLIEGCHARVGLVTDIAFMDGLPARYDFDVRRQHRWTRGDWQLLPWLGKRVPTAEGWRSNPLSMISRWKILDNLRRSLVQPALLLMLVMGWTVLPGAAGIWTLAGLLVLTFPLLLDLMGVLRSRPPEVTWQDQWRAFAGHVSRSVAQAACAIIFLPHRAESMVDGAVRALSRTYFTHRKMLEWECAAAMENRLKGSRWQGIISMWFAPALSFALIAVAVMGGFKPHAVAVAAPLLLAWIVSPFIAQWVSISVPVRYSGNTPEQRQWLWQIARKTWGFFETHVGPEDHWLPPDNVYETGPRHQLEEKVAHQISPTNEGLFLVSALVAHDLGFLEVNQFVDMLEANLDTWESLEQLRGHHFNWYDTTTLKPKPPRYVSTVDNGNLAACLATMEQGLHELANRQPQPLQDRLLHLSQRCGRMVAGMDFGMLYDQQRGLFHIGLNVETGKLDAGHYDLLASEARLASYIAIAKGDVDHRHWFQLGRGLTRVADRSCVLSWSGSMFEYLMPTLFTRTIPDSLIDHACRAAVARQIQYGRRKHVPWGMSESAFYSKAYGADFGYQAFGVPGLGLQRGLEQELVVAPYATALALEFDPDAAARNLSALADIGALGRYGFYDAIDYTSHRLPSGRRNMIISCYMAHHQGMTLISLGNCLRDHCIQRRFHANPRVRTAELLLQERVPEGSIPTPQWSDEDESERSEEVSDLSSTGSSSDSEKEDFATSKPAQLPDPIIEPIALRDIVDL